jgi:acetate kinase
LDYLGIKLNDERNRNHEEIISEDSYGVKVMRIPTNEELVIALDTSEIVKGIEVKNHAL